MKRGNMLVTLAGWGRYPRVESVEHRPMTISGIKDLLDGGFEGIARGLGRSYGDASLFKESINLCQMDHMIAFDEALGMVTLEAGVSIEDIVKTFLPRGWFPFVTPGTRFVTVGGAIASDVHGKNHHIEGSFCDYVSRIVLLTADGVKRECSRKVLPELFRATCGGMGLTGIILEATLRLKPVKSAFIEETIIKTPNVETLIDLFSHYNETTYSVAWIDCVSSGKDLGRSLLMLGEHASDETFTHTPKRKSVVPFDFPEACLNRYSIALFNTLYYHKVLKKKSALRVPYDTFFYPLDAMMNWNRIYGKKGFVQYQFLIPFSAGKKGLTAILEKIAHSKKGSFLAILKTFGKGNENDLSFPEEGFTLALDFKMKRDLFALLDDLDEMVIDYGGRLYLTKDARMRPAVFKKSYPELDRFLSVKAQYDKKRRFKSLLSERLEVSYG